MTTSFRALVRKDMQLFFVDRRSVLMSFVAPIVIASFFGYIFGGQGGQTTASRIPVLIVDSDGSAVSRQIVASLAGDQALDVKPSSLDAARAAVRKGKAMVAILIPAGFGADAARALFGADGADDQAILAGWIKRNFGAGGSHFHQGHDCRFIEHFR